MDRTALDAAHAAAVRFLEGVSGRPVGAAAGPEAMRAALGGPLPEHGEPAGLVIEELAKRADPGLVATAGPRFFGFVIGGSLPAAVGADWLTSAWDQNAGLFVLSPAAAVVEETVRAWLTGLFGLPAGTGMGMVTGGQMANTACLAAARQHVLARAGWDVAAQGLSRAPEVAVLAGEEAHITIYGALRLLGLGDASVVKVAADGQGRMMPDAIRDALGNVRGRPAIVCAQAGNVNTGAFDPLPEITRLAREHGGAWVHVDGAFGLWAAASSHYRHLVSGAGDADSWATNAHKWLTVPRWPGAPLISSARLPIGTTTSGRLSSRAAREDFPSMPPCARWAARESRRWWSAAAPMRACSRRFSRRLRACRWSTKWSSTRRWFAAKAPAPRSSRATGGPRT